MPAVLFICLGNICRSPLAEGLFRKVADPGTVIDSAGTGNYHVGELPDPRSQSVGKKHGAKMTMRARQLTAQDFQDFDLIIGMDRNNVHDIRTWPGSIASKIKLLGDFHPEHPGIEVPDPYYDTTKEFEAVAKLIEECLPSLLNHVRSLSPAK